MAAKFLLILKKFLQMIFNGYILNFKDILYSLKGDINL
jgi:hypothetical protein